MTFANPVFLQLGVGLALLVPVGLWSHARRRRRLAEFLGGPRAATRLSGTDLYRLRLERMFLLGLAALALAAAAAEPRWQAPEVEPPPPIRSVVLAIDVSASMQAVDVSPTRLAQVVQVARELLATLERDRVGLLLFAGAAYPLAPPTRDHEALDYLLRGLTPTIASFADPGTLVSVGIHEALRLFGDEGEHDGGRSIIVIGDGEAGEAEAAVTAAVEAAVAEGIVVHAIGIGTERGAGMVPPKGSYRAGRRILDARGAPAVSRLRVPLLRRIAEAGGGGYAAATDAAGLRSVHSAFEAPVREPVLQEAPPIWAGLDLTFYLALATLLCLLIESLLDVRLPGTAVVPARRIA